MREMLQLSVLKDTIFHKSQIAFGSHFDWLIKSKEWERVLSAAAEWSSFQ